MGAFESLYLAIELKSKTRNGQLVEASHLLNIVDSLNRLGFFPGGEGALIEGSISDGEVRIYFE